MIYWTVISIASVIGGVSLWMHFTKRKTVSQRIQDAFPKWLDFLIMNLALGAGWLIGGEKLFAPLIVGVIIGHWFWQE